MLRIVTEKVGRDDLFVAAMADLGTNLFDILWCESDGLRDMTSLSEFF